ncbi:hypothetical protein A0256_19765 [Mucilaginibacter sp. PAMC 26640]|nr:hypothetical protein A0256_19765 [Mucilaginibacter sp. PAMC 26640]
MDFFLRVFFWVIATIFRLETYKKALLTNFPAQAPVLQPGFFYAFLNKLRSKSCYYLNKKSTRITRVLFLFS